MVKNAQELLNKAEELDHTLSTEFVGKQNEWVL